MLAAPASRPACVIGILAAYSTSYTGDAAGIADVDSRTAARHSRRHVLRCDEAEHGCALVGRRSAFTLFSMLFFRAMSCRYPGI